jgi:signal transduction histidine kinase
MQLYQSAAKIAAQTATTEMDVEDVVQKVLLIEDNPGDARLVEIMLEESDLLNCKVTNKQTLAEGIKALQEAEFDVVLLDLTLPDTRGFETLEKLIKKCPDVNVIVMTGLADKQIGLNAVKAGAQDFLLKGGYDPDQLAKTLRYSIDRKSVLNRLAESQRAREVAEESARLKEQFIASISHEMRTPMNAIYGMSNLLAQTPLNEEQQSYITSVKKSSEILLGVINDILEISTLQNGRMDFDSKPFEIKDLLVNVVNVMQYKKNEKDLQFVLNIPPDVPKLVKGDTLRLNQILFNIVGNAVKFTDHGFVKIFVKKLDSVLGKTRLRFSVEDSGIGMPPDKVHTIFETFTRIRTKDRVFEGTGLGLAIVKNLVVQQEGIIGASSILGKGSTIFFELMFDNIEIVDVNAPKVVSNVPEVPKPLNDKNRSFRLLLTEDHKMNQIVAKKTLEKHFPNIQLKIANHGKEAIDILEKTPDFDVILMDIQMPVMDGNEATAYIRQNMPHVTAPILAMTAHAYISKDEIFKTYGFDNFVLKPFEPEDLFSKIHLYLNKKIF